MFPFTNTIEWNCGLYSYFYCHPDSIPSQVNYIQPLIHQQIIYNNKTKRTEENIDVALRMQMVGSSLVMIPVAMFISNAVLPRNFEIVKFIVDCYVIIITIFNVYTYFFLLLYDFQIGISGSIIQSSSFDAFVCITSGTLGLINIQIKNQYFFT